MSGRADTTPSNTDQLVLRGAASPSVSSVSPPATAESGVEVTEANEHGQTTMRQVSRWFDAVHYKNNGTMLIVFLSFKKAYL